MKISISLLLGFLLTFSHVSSVFSTQVTYGFKGVTTYIEDNTVYNNLVLTILSQELYLTTLILHLA